MTGNNRDITVLNTLIATLIDSIDGYEEWEEDIDNEEFAEKFGARARERKEVVRQLRSAVMVADGEPEDDGTILAGAHRAFLNLKEAVVGRGDNVIVDEIERGEDYLKAKFKTALADTELSPNAHAAIEKAWASVQAGHDEMSALKHSMK